MTRRLAVVAALLPLVAVPTASAATVLMISPLTLGMEKELQGSICQAGNTCFQVGAAPYPFGGGVASLDSAIDTAVNNTSGPIIVFGYSNGAKLVALWLRDQAGDPDAPSPDELSFVLIGNASRAYGGTSAPMPQTRYHVVDVAREYDMAADYPNNPSSPYYFLAVLNTLAGFGPIHANYVDVDIDDPANIVWTVGNTTYTLVPTPTLPLLMPIQALGINVDALNGWLKPLVDSAYDRSYIATAQPSTPLAASAVAEPTVSDQDATATQSLAPLPTPATVAAPMDSAPAADVPGSSTAPALDAGAAGLQDARAMPPIQAQRGLGTSPDTAPAQERANRVDPTDGNKVEPGLMPPKNSTDELQTDIRRDVQEPESVTNETNPASDNLMDAPDRAKQGGPSVNDDSTGGCEGTE